MNTHTRATTRPPDALHAKADALNLSVIAVVMAALLWVGVLFLRHREAMGFQNANQEPLNQIEK